MELAIDILALVATYTFAALKSNIDVNQWYNVDHGMGAVYAFFVLTMISVCALNPFPFFLYGGSFDQMINIKRGLPFFYVGKTAWYDQQLRKLGRYAGQIEFTIMNLIGLILLFTL